MTSQPYSAVSINGVRKAFANVVAVDSLSIEVPVGAIYGFLGPNGAGKTTTIRMILGILRPDAGEISVLGHNDPTALKSRLGYLPEEKGLYKKMKVIELVTYFGRLKGMSKQAARASADGLLQRFGLAEWRQEKCETLSKGMAQKVQITTTLVHSPDLVVLDEPFSGLDPVNIELVRDTILELKSAGKTVIFSTHIMEQAEQICDSIVLINKGRKVLDGTIADVRASTGNTVVLDYDGDGSCLQKIPGVIRVSDAGKHAELTLAAGTDPQALLAALIGKVAIRRFDTAQASLHEVFIRTVGADRPPGEPDAL
ncbi:MAG: ATP-binding cassette domain-containing protein [Gammaproteobacteria bacterium]|nr:ATP-binding cassette domain-containing protein [Gammaproteobacteria bacterium]